jgi:hypothetical protein
VERFGSTFFFMAVAFNFIVQLRNLVSEKQEKLRKINTKKLKWRPVHSRIWKAL